MRELLHVVGDPEYMAKRVDEIFPPEDLPDEHDPGCDRHAEARVVEGDDGILRMAMAWCRCRSHRLIHGFEQRRLPG